MGVIVANETVDSSGTPVVGDENRRKAGMQVLGALLREQTGAAASKNEYATGLATAMQSMISGIGAARYLLVYHKDLAGQSFPIESASASGATVNCDLTGSANPLVINVEMENHGASLRMAVVFPLPTERNSYVYIGDAASDVTDLTPDNAFNYLMAFKFLGRCR